MRYVGAARAIAIVAVLTVGVSACSSARGGQTAREASVQVRAIRGVESGEVRATNYRSGLTSTWQAQVSFSPSSEFAARDESVVRDLLRVGWTVNDHKLDDGVSLTVVDAPDVDLVAVAKKSGVEGVLTIGDDRSTFVVAPKDLVRMFGEWPAEAR